MQNSFSEYNPIINFVFYFSVIAFGMFFMHPVYIAVSLILSTIYYLMLKGRQGLKFLLFMVVIIFFSACINPLFNSYGDNVLFTFASGRNYTLDAMLYGFASGTMLVNILIWFASYNIVMCSDKFIYLFGKVLPSLSLVLSMVMRYVPNFENKLKVIVTARRCIGKVPESNTKAEKFENISVIMGILTSWALEGGVITADSMKARGYGLTPRTSFAIYRFDSRDKSLLAIVLSLIGIIIFASSKGGTYVQYYPRFEVASLNISGFLGMLAFLVLASIPVIINTMEAIVWHNLKSKI